MDGPEEAVLDLEPVLFGLLAHLVRVLPIEAPLVEVVHVLLSEFGSKLLPRVACFDDLLLA